MPFTTSKAKSGAETGLTSTPKKFKGKKVRSKAARDIGEDSDEDVYSDGNMYSNASDEEEGEDAAIQKPSNPRLQLQKTWSVSAFNISGHSAGVVYLDESDNNDTDDDSSSYDEFGSDSANDDLFVSDGEEEDNTTANEIKSNKTRRTSREEEQGKPPSPLSSKRSSFTFKKEMKQRENAAETILEGDEEEEIEDVSNSNDNDNESESDDDSISDFQLPASMRRQSTISKFSSNDGGNFDSGYSSDSALVRKRMQMLQQEQDARRKEGTQKSSNGGKKKKKKGGKKKGSSKKKEKKKSPKNRNSLEKENSARSGLGSLEGDNSTATTISGGSEEEVRQEEMRQSSEIKDDNNGKKKKKKKKQKTKKTKDGKKKKKRAVISFVVNGDDDACADFDKRLEEIEQFEAALVEERKSIQKERETMAFERESMEMRMDEESHHCDGLNRRIRELEQLVQSQKLSNAGNDAESSNEKNGLKLDFAREKREFHLQLVEKEREIEDLKLTVRELQMLQGATKNADDNSFDSNSKGDGKSRERLQGELLQTVAKLSEKEAQLKAQSKELDLTREEVATLKLKCETSELKKVFDASKEDNKKLQQEMENERKENNTKLKDKDETVTFLMNELARLKKEQSISTKGR